MKQKTMILIALAVVCGLGASFMTSKLLADRQSQEETIKILVAKKNLDTGIMLKKPEEVFEEKEILKETAPKNVLTKFEDVKNRQLKIPRRAGDNITLDDLYDDKGPGLMNTLPPGHRAVGIRVSSEMIAAGFAAVPHSRIDIACRVTSQDERQSGTRIVLQNVLVLASGQATVRDEGGKPMLCDVVTVALTPEDACKLETIKGKGTLTMFLRPFGESSKVEVGLVTYDRAIAKKGSEYKGEDGDEGLNPKGPSAVDGLVVPPTTGAVKLEAEKQPVNDKQVVFVTNGAKKVKITYTLNADGQWDSFEEVVTSPTVKSPVPAAQPAKPPTTAAPTAQSAKEPSTPAPAAPAQKLQ